jgi:hypothetical protein
MDGLSMVLKALEPAAARHKAQFRKGERGDKVNEDQNK